MRKFLKTIFFGKKGKTTFAHLHSINFSTLRRVKVEINILKYISGLRRLTSSFCHSVVESDTDY